MARYNALQTAMDLGFITIKEYGDEESTYARPGDVKMLRHISSDDVFLVIVKVSTAPGDWVDRYGLMFADEAQEVFKECVMTKDLLNAKLYSRHNNCTVYAASNGSEIIWSDSRSQVERDGFWICQIFEDGHAVEA